MLLPRLDTSRSSSSTSNLGFGLGFRPGLALIAVLSLGFGGCSDNAKNPATDSSATPSATKSNASTPSMKSSAPTSSAAPATSSEKPSSSGEDTQPPGALHDVCLEDRHCESGICKTIKVQKGDQVSTYGVCAACRDHQHCVDKGLGVSCNMDYEAGHYKCGNGDLGSACETNKQCASHLICALLNLGDNDSFTRVCSECAKHSDCPADGNRNCIARYNPKGEMFNQCLPDKARKMGEVCFPCETGDRECDGVCAVAQDPDAGNGLCIGVCGECKSNKDCPEGEICQPPEFHFDNSATQTPHTPSRCIKPSSR